MAMFAPQTLVIRMAAVSTAITARPAVTAMNVRKVTLVMGGVVSRVPQLIAMMEILALRIHVTRRLGVCSRTIPCLVLTVVSVRWMTSAWEEVVSQGLH